MAWGRLLGLPDDTLSRLIDKMTEGTVLPSEVFTMVDVSDATISKLISDRSVDSDNPIDYNTLTYFKSTLGLQASLDRVLDISTTPHTSPLVGNGVSLPVDFTTAANELQPSKLLRKKISASSVDAIFNEKVTTPLSTMVFGDADAYSTYWNVFYEEVGYEWSARLKNLVGRFARFYEYDPHMPFTAFIDVEDGALASIRIYSDFYNNLARFRVKSAVGCYGEAYQKQLIDFSRAVTYSNDANANVASVRDRCMGVLSNIGPSVLVADMELSRITFYIEAYDALVQLGAATDADMEAIKSRFTDIVTYVDNTLEYIEQGFYLVLDNLRSIQEV